MPDRPHLSWPITFSPTGFVTVEQDTADDVASCIATILSWPLGTHPSDPNFGVPDESFLQGGASLAEIKQAILQSEPRADQLTIMQDDTALAAFLSSINVSFTVRETA
jgi:phage baseplate assembly protein W